jgi:hypothetical protein
MYYAGIGSRQTPSDILQLFEKVAIYLSKKNYILRSGHASGSDQSFENGCDSVNGKKEIYLPWKNFNNSDSDLVVADPKAFEIAKEFHPYWHNLKQGGQKLQARNSHQVLGLDLNTPSKFIICWTKKGAGVGGTGQAIRIAHHYGIPVFDAGIYGDIEDVRKELKVFFERYL